MADGSGGRRRFLKLIASSRNVWDDSLPRLGDMLPRKTLYLSFVDNDRPVGQQFLGACVVDVTAADLALRRPWLEANAPHVLADPTLQLVDAAIFKAHLMGCNPGGAVATSLLPTDDPAYADRIAAMPRNRLLSRTELAARGIV